MFDADMIDDCFNKVSTDLEEWLNEGMANFQKGAINRTADTIWSKQPEGLKQQARQQLPQATSILDGLRKGQK